ncbi:MAG: polymer-forming cytoskeletal protein [Candidatus Hodarchaeota archaeon]
MLDGSEKAKRMLEALDERLRNGDISQEEYNQLKAKYQARLESSTVEEEDTGQEKAKKAFPRMISISGSGQVTEDHISISGSGSVEGWHGGSIKISGSGKISEDQISVSGSAKLSGDLKSEIIKSSGSLKVEGDVQARVMKSSGSTKIEGDLIVEDEAKFSGSAKIEGNVQVKDGDLKASGAAKIEGNVEAKDVFFGGAFQIGGDVSTDTFEAEMGDKCAIGGILRATNVDIKQDRRRAYLKVKEIHATGRVYLEGVSADVVAGKKVELGPDCDVKEVREES